MVRVNVLALVVVGGLAVSAFGQEDGQVYRIKNRMTDKVLAPDADGTLLIQTKPNGKDTAQQWKLTKAKEGNFFRITNVSSGKVLVAPSKEALAQIALEEPAKGTAKAGVFWSFDKRDARFVITSRYSGLCLDVFNFEKENGTKIIQQTLNEKGGRGNQIWELVPVK